MKVQDRPYAGNWSEDFLNKYRTTRSWTPDAIVTFNGETTLPGCPTCNNKIDFSRFINSVNTGGGVDGTNSCDIQLKIPWSYGDSVYKDGRFILTTGIEVFVYYRGFFQVKELALKADNIDLENGETLSAPDAETRPYYPVFHGVISQVSVDYSDGAYSVSIGTRNMLSFWDNQQINTQQGYFAADPTMSRGSMNLRGHVYTNMTPHQIIYDLFLDAGGSAEGTGFALSKSSNITARASTGQQNYSLMMRYLEQRFKNGMYGLRMYGASGRMYSAIETQIIANQEITKSEKEAEFRSVIKRQNKPYTKPKSKEKSFSRMVKAGMIAYEFDNATKGRVQRTVDGRQLTKLSEKDKTGLSVLSLKPFVSDLGNFAQVSFFESNMESKKSIAERVCQTTGYEFYQDMDGDLVFKPPMYNMDTSGDRVYSIYREDIISISYSHNEPEATYITMKGSHFRNFDGAAPTGEWGVKGVYVDYALVAKYGWKGQDFDSSFYNTAKQAYYAAAVELDKQNKNTETCDITIPLRPELKPGYPIYVEENDCFYYVESVNHSFSYGGSCTTSLSLVCQRKKFIPPGDRGVKYSEDPARAVDLGRTELPEKYIYKRYDRTDEGRQINAQNTTTDQAIANDLSYRKITGFPNVVMAFDHQNVNPSMLYYDPDFQTIGRAGTKERERYLNMIINEGIRLGILQVKEGDDLREGPWILYVPTADNKVRLVNLGLEPTSARVSTVRGKGSKRRVITRKPSKGQRSAQSSLGNRNIAGINALDTISLQSGIDGQRAAEKIGRGKAAQAEKHRRAEQTRQENLQGNIQAAVGTAGVYDAGNTLVQGNSSNATILDLIYLIRSKLGSGEQNSPLQNLMSALQDRKSSFAPKAQGYFRYYSSSHPSPEHQGPDLTEHNLNNPNKTPKITFNDNTPDTVKDNVVKASPDGDGDTVIFGNNADSRQQIVRGLLTRTMYSSGLEYVPTKDILQLSFQVSSNFSVDNVAGPTVQTTQVWYQQNYRPGTAYWQDIFSVGLTSVGFTLFLFEKVGTIFKYLNEGAENPILSLTVPLVYKPMPPAKWGSDEANSYFSEGVEIKPTMSDKLEDLGIKREDGKPIKARNMKKHFAQVLYHTLRKGSFEKFPDSYSQSIWEQLPTENDPETLAKKNELVLNVEKYVRRHLSKLGRRNLLPLADNHITLPQSKIKVNTKRQTITPIFPISDAKGYEVFGAYQYGRGLNPSRGTLFDALLRQDPSQILSPKELKEAMDKLDKAKSGTDFRAMLRELYLKRIRKMMSDSPEDIERLKVGLGLDSEVRDQEGAIISEENALANRLMTRTDEQIITNIPAALTEIYPQEEGSEVCECRIHNTDAILLEGSLELNNFLEIENPLLRSVRAQTERKSAEWREHQSGLRGENLTRIQGAGFNSSFNDRAGNRLIDAFSNPFASAVANVENNTDDLSDRARAIKAQAARIDDPFTGEND